LFAILGVMRKTRVTGQREPTGRSVQDFRPKLPEKSFL